jgi:hypothetical protein
MSIIPKIRAEMFDVANDPDVDQRLAAIILDWEKRLHRRPAMRRARRRGGAQHRSQGEIEKLKNRVIKFATVNPTLTQHQIANHLKLRNAGRVSEYLTGRL